MFKLLPLGRSEGEPVPSIHHQAERERERTGKMKRVKGNQRAQRLMSDSNK